MLFIAIETSTTRDRSLCDCSHSHQTFISGPNGRCPEVLGIDWGRGIRNQHGCHLVLRAPLGRERAVSCFTLCFLRWNQHCLRGCRRRRQDLPNANADAVPCPLVIALLSPRNWEFYFCFACEKVETPPS